MGLGKFFRRSSKGSRGSYSSSHAVQPAPLQPVSSSHAYTQHTTTYPGQPPYHHQAPQQYCSPPSSQQSMQHFPQYHSQLPSQQYQHPQAPSSDTSVKPASWYHRWTNRSRYEAYRDLKRSQDTQAPSTTSPAQAVQHMDGSRGQWSQAPTDFGLPPGSVSYPGTAQGLRTQSPLSVIDTRYNALGPAYCGSQATSQGPTHGYGTAQMAPPLQQPQPLPYQRQQPPLPSTYNVSPPVSPRPERLFTPSPVHQEYSNHPHVMPPSTSPASTQGTAQLRSLPSPSSPSASESAHVSTAPSSPAPLHQPVPQAWGPHSNASSDHLDMYALSPDQQTISQWHDSTGQVNTTSTHLGAQSRYPSNLSPITELPTPVPSPLHLDAPPSHSQQLAPDGAHYGPPVPQQAGWPAAPHVGYADQDRGSLNVSPISDTGSTVQVHQPVQDQLIQAASSTPSTYSSDFQASPDVAHPAYRQAQSPLPSQVTMPNHQSHAYGATPYQIQPELVPQRLSSVRQTSLQASNTTAPTTHLQPQAVPTPYRPQATDEYHQALRDIAKPVQPPQSMPVPAARGTAPRVDVPFGFEKVDPRVSSHGAHSEDTQLSIPSGDKAASIPHHSVPMRATLEDTAAGSQWGQHVLRAADFQLAKTGLSGSTPTMDDTSGASGSTTRTDLRGAPANPQYPYPIVRHQAPWAQYPPQKQQVPPQPTSPSIHDAYDPSMSAITGEHMSVCASPSAYSTFSQDTDVERPGSSWSQYDDKALGAVPSSAYTQIEGPQRGLHRPMAAVIEGLDKAADHYQYVQHDLAPDRGAAESPELLDPDRARSTANSLDLGVEQGSRTSSVPSQYSPYAARSYGNEQQLAHTARSTHEAAPSTSFVAELDGQPIQRAPMSDIPIAGSRSSSAYSTGSTTPTASSHHDPGAFSPAPSGSSMSTANSANNMSLHGAMMKPPGPAGRPLQHTVRGIFVPHAR